MGFWTLKNRTFPRIIVVHSIHILSSVFVILYSMKLVSVVGPVILFQLHDCEGLIYGVQSMLSLLLYLNALIYA